VLRLRGAAGNPSRARRLVSVHPLVGDAKKDASRVSVGRRDRATDARVKPDALSVDRERRPEGAFDGSDDSRATLRPAVGKQDRELVAAQSRAHVGLSNAAAQPLCGPEQNGVAGMVPVHVFDLLEPVEV
jgi:hypothetical protein